MNNYFFREGFYESRYNCSAYTYKEWESMGSKNPILGACFLFIGVITQAIYMPMMAGMMQKKFRAMSCYKIMFYLGVVDMGNIFVGAYVTGYLTWVGAVFCTHPRIIYFCGLIGVCSWCSACMACCLLAFNRCVDFTRADLSDKMFFGNKTWLWILLPIGYFLWIFVFEMPVIYDSNYATWFYDPFMAVPVHYDYYYSNTTHAINNVAVIFILCAENAFLCHSIFKLSGQMSSSIRRKRQFIIQTLVICALVVVAAAVYVYMNYFYIPPILTIIGTLAYAANSGLANFPTKSYFFAIAPALGSPGVVYLILNKNLRRASFRLFSESFQKISHRSTVSSASANDNTPTHSINPDL